MIVLNISTNTLASACCNRNFEEKTKQKKSSVEGGEEAEWMKKGGMGVGVGGGMWAGTFKYLSVFHNMNHRRSRQRERER